MIFKNFTFFTIVFLVFFTVNSQNNWIYPSAKKIKESAVISFEVIYENKLTEAQKRDRSYLSDIVVTINGNTLIQRKFYPNIKNINVYNLYDYKRLKYYTCNITGSRKNAIEYNFSSPSKEVDQLNETKEIIGFKCNKALNTKGKEIYYTKALGYRFCGNYNIDGFLLQYPGYSKKLGRYTVKAKKIQYAKLPTDLFSLEGFSVQTKKEYNEARKKYAAEKKAKELKSIGKKAPSFSAIDMDGTRIKSKNFNNQVTVLNFWFTTCPPCKKEIPSLNKLKNKYSKNKNVNFVSMATDPEYKLANFLAKHKFNYKVIPEASWIAGKFDVSAYPTNIIIDKYGVIQFFSTGYRSDIVDRMSYKIDKLLK